MVCGSLCGCWFMIRRAPSGHSKRSTPHPPRVIYTATAARYTPCTMSPFLDGAYSQARCKAGRASVLCGAPYSSLSPARDQAWILKVGPAYDTRPPRLLDRGRARRTVQEFLGHRDLNDLHDHHDLHPRAQQPLTGGNPLSRRPVAGEPMTTRSQLQSPLPASHPGITRICVTPRSRAGQWASSCWCSMVCSFARQASPSASCRFGLLRPPTCEDLGNVN
jgi:hypothetical protein